MIILETKYLLIVRQWQFFWHGEFERIKVRESIDLTANLNIATDFTDMLRFDEASTLLNIRLRN